MLIQNHLPYVISGKRGECALKSMRFNTIVTESRLRCVTVGLVLSNLFSFEKGGGGGGGGGRGQLV